MPILTTAQTLRWGCPVTLNATPPPPQKDTDGSRLLLHVVDAAGNNFEVRCVPTITSFYYEYTVSLPNGSRTEISRCIYSRGLNALEIVYTGAKTETTSPTGTPVINVGSIKVLQHTNIEATGNAFQGLRPKVGGADFHMIYDYGRRFRYRINTTVRKNGRPRGNSTDYFCSAVGNALVSGICRAEAQPIESRLDILAAMESDTWFRCLDDPAAEDPGDRYEHQCIYADNLPLGYTLLEDGNRRGAVLLDQGLCGSLVDVTDTGIQAYIPPVHGRDLATLAVETTLIPGYEAGTQLVLEIDGRRQQSEIKTTGSMVAAQVPVDGSARFLEIGCKP